MSRLSQVNRYNPYLRANVGTGRTFATTADLMNGAHWTNEQLDNQRYFNEDRERMTGRNPNVMAMKKRALLSKGYTEDEADELASDPKFWRPEFAGFMERPYSVDPNFGGNMGGSRGRRIREAKKRIDDDTEIKRYALDRQQQLRDEYFADDEKSGARQAPVPERGSARAPAGRRVAGVGGTAQDVNAMDFADKGTARTQSLPAGVADPKNDYFGHQFSDKLNAAKSAIDAERAIYDDAVKRLQAAQDLMASAGKNATGENRLNLTRAKRDADASAARLKEKQGAYDGVASDAEDYGFQINGGKVLNPHTGRVYDYSSQLNPKQQAQINSGLDALEKTGSINEEDDYFNPQGARAKLTAYAKQHGDLSGFPVSALPGAKNPYDPSRPSGANAGAVGARRPMTQSERNTVEDNLNRLDRAHVLGRDQFALEDDYFNPTGARAQITAQVRKNGAGGDYVGTTDAATGQTRFAPYGSAYFNENGEVQMKPISSNDHYITKRNMRSEFEREAGRLSVEHPEWSPVEIENELRRKASDMKARGGSMLRTGGVGAGNTFSPEPPVKEDAYAGYFN